MNETAANSTQTGGKKKLSPTAAYYLRIIGTLFAITAVVAVILGIVNLVTQPTIDRLAAEKRAASMAEVMPGCTFGDANVYTGDDAAILGMTEASRDGALAGWCVQVESNGFGGALQLMVGVDTSGTVTGVCILKHSETLNTDRHGDLVVQYPGHSGTVALSKDGGDISAISGATVTSRAVTRGVDAALQAAAGMIR